MERVFSGVKPSGGLTLGNYIGAIRNFVHVQHDADCLFCVVDLHAITVPQEPEELYRWTLDVARLYVACGIDPGKATIFVQSHVPAHSELSWLLGCFTYMGELRRMTQFKEKSEGQESVASALFTYPVLMAADILLYQTDKVPVGEDQKQHLELSRDIAMRMNNRFGNTFKVPEPYIPDKRKGGRIMSLDNPLQKMGKSHNPAGTIYLLDTPDMIAKKVRSAVTDSGREVYYEEVEKPAISNLMVIYSLCAGVPLEDVEAQFRTAGYGTFKNAVADAVVGLLEPIQARFAELNEPGTIENVLAAGARRANELAAPTLDRVRERIGLVT